MLKIYFGKETFAVLNKRNYFLVKHYSMIDLQPLSLFSNFLGKLNTLTNRVLIDSDPPIS